MVYVRGIFPTSDANAYVSLSGPSHPGGARGLYAHGRLPELIGAHVEPAHRTSVTAHPSQ